jgi:hypothetical protein
MEEMVLGARRGQNASKKENEAVNLQDQTLGRSFRMMLNPVGDEGCGYSNLVPDCGDSRLG